MMYEIAAIAALAHQCAPEVATEAVVPLVVTESGGDSLAINVNRGPRVRAGSVTEGATLVRRFIAAGYTVDVGLAQVNSANFERLGLTVEQAFDPCANLAAASSVLRESYGRASRQYSSLDAISATYSLYNTGTMTRGLFNGYVGRIWSAANALGSIPATPALPVASPANSATAAKPRNDPDDWVVGQLASNSVEVFR